MSKSFADSYSEDDFDEIEEVSGHPSSEPAPDAPTVDAQTLQTWEIERPHREHISKMMMTSVLVDSPTLCVLGARECLTLDVEPLLRRFSHLTLVDPEPETVGRGMKMHNATGKNVKIAESSDFSGVSQLLFQYKEQPSEQLLNQVFQTLESYLIPNLEQHDMVVSNCVLSRILYHAVVLVGLGHHRIIDLLRLMRQRHIETMLAALKPGGIGLLLTEFVSSDTIPALSTDENLDEIMTAAIEAGKYLHGLNPAMVRQMFDHEPLAAQIENASLSKFWRWPTKKQTYACYAIAFEKRK